MSTRKLIGLALACAVAIMLAGGIQLIILANRDVPRLDRDDALAVAEAVDGRTVSEVRVEGADVVVVVTDDSGAEVDPGRITVFSDTGDDVRRGSSQCIPGRCELSVPSGAAQLEDLLLSWTTKGVTSLWSLAPGSD